MNVNEYGVQFLFSTGFDMSGYSALALHFVKPDLSTLVVTNPAVTVGSGNVSTTAGLFLANQYAQYTFVNGDVDQVGEWSVRLVYDDSAPRHLISDIATFEINP
jgi:hypothetical protein